MDKNIKNKKILIINAHPYDKSYGNALAQAYFNGAKDGGIEVKLTNLRELNFDPILHSGYSEIQELEPDLTQQQELIKWCNHIVIVTPLWWAGMPGLLKGYFDRVFLPGFAFKYSETSPMPQKLLIGRSARVIYTQGAPFIFSFLCVGDSFWRMIKDGCLSFCGFSPVKRFVIDRMPSMDEAKRALFLKKVYNLGKGGE